MQSHGIIFQKISCPSLEKNQRSEKIEKDIIRWNKEHSHQTHGTTCTIYPISSLLEDNSFTKFGSDILLGTS